MEQVGLPIVSILILVFQGVVTLIVSIVGWWVKGIVIQLREMNGNVRDLTAWKDVHGPQDDKWHDENRQDHREIWKELKSIREEK